jgi:trans-aconitate methyltransferase
LKQDEAGLDYEGVKQYWSNARPSILGPYMMDGFGFPAAAGRFRFHAENQIVQKLIRGVNGRGTVLDLGCGVGYWTEFFARHFNRVVAIEGSRPLYEATKERCASYPNVKTIHGDVVAFEPEDRYDLVFLGGLLMYLNESDVVDLLRKVIASLEPGGMILCRESTVRKGTLTHRDSYQVVYRSIQTYTRIFMECGISSIQVKRNVPYLLLQMGCELIKKWKAFVPERLQVISTVGHIVYWGLRAGNPWITRIPGVFGLTFPKLTNHFFVLRAD